MALVRSRRGLVARDINCEILDNPNIDGVTGKNVKVRLSTFDPDDPQPWLNNPDGLPEQRYVSLPYETFKKIQDVQPEAKKGNNEYLRFNADLIPKSEYIDGSGNVVYSSTEFDINPDTIAQPYDSLSQYLSISDEAEHIKIVDTMASKAADYQKNISPIYRRPSYDVEPLTPVTAEERARFLAHRSDKIPFIPDNGFNNTRIVEDTRKRDISMDDVSQHRAVEAMGAKNHGKAIRPVDYVEPRDGDQRARGIAQAGLGATVMAGYLKGKDAVLKGTFDPKLSDDYYTRAAIIKIKNNEMQGLPITEGLNASEIKRFYDWANEEMLLNNPEKTFGGVGKQDPHLDPELRKIFSSAKNRRLLDETAFDIKSRTTSLTGQDVLKQSKLDQVMFKYLHFNLSDIVHLVVKGLEKLHILDPAKEGQYFYNLKMMSEPSAAEYRRQKVRELNAEREKQWGSIDGQNSKETDSEAKERTEKEYDDIKRRESLTRETNRREREEQEEKEQQRIDVDPSQQPDTKGRDFKIPSAEDTVSKESVSQVVYENQPSDELPPAVDLYGSVAGKDFVIGGDNKPGVSSGYISPELQAKAAPTSVKDAVKNEIFTPDDAGIEQGMRDSAVKTVVVDDTPMAVYSPDGTTVEVVQNTYDPSLNPSVALDKNYENTQDLTK